MKPDSKDYLLYDTMSVTFWKKQSCRLGKQMPGMGGGGVVDDRLQRGLGEFFEATDCFIS